MQDSHPNRRRRRRRPGAWPAPDVDIRDWRKGLERLEGAYSPYTLRSYEGDFRLFAEWCLAEGRAALPAKPETVALYLADIMHRLKPTTLKRRLCGIAKLHRIFDLPNPTDHFDVDLAIRRARRLKPQSPAQALGITAAIRDRLLAACGTDMVGLRDQALVAIGFDTLCRRGELVALAAEDLAPNHYGTLSILVRRAKNDPYGTGRIAHLSGPTVRIVQSWLKAAEISRGPLLRPVYSATPFRASWSPIRWGGC